MTDEDLWKTRLNAHALAHAKRRRREDLAVLFWVLWEGWARWVALTILIAGFVWWSWGKWAPN